MSQEFKWIHVNNADELKAFYLSVLPMIKEAARSCGYAIGIHGSLRRDLDLIAVPWAEDHVDRDTLAEHIHLAACGLRGHKYDWEEKPMGRVATGFPICWTWHETPTILGNGHIDLSIMSGVSK